jgi:hypothetical protein
MVRYPHILTAAIVNINAERDELGNWLPSGNTTELMIPCRAEPNGNSVVTLPDGTQYNFAYMVYLPQGTQTLPTGIKVRITDGEQLDFRSTAKLFFSGQLNCRLWL